MLSGLDRSEPFKCLRIITQTEPGAFQLYELTLTPGLVSSGAEEQLNKAPSNCTIACATTAISSFYASKGKWKSSVRSAKNDI